VNETV